MSARSSGVSCDRYSETELAFRIMGGAPWEPQFTFSNFQFPMNIWRRERDSNPRCPYGHSDFQDRRLKPLGHLSALSILAFDPVQSPHVGFQRFRNKDRPIRLLIVLDYRNPGAADGQPRAIQRVRELDLAGTVRAIANRRAACLERFGVRAGRDLAIRLLTREPHFDVVRLR